jgi:hypothetical protein
MKVCMVCRRLIFPWFLIPAVPGNPGFFAFPVSRIKRSGIPGNQICLFLRNKHVLFIFIFSIIHVLCLVFHDNCKNDANISVTHISDEFESTFIKLAFFGLHVFFDCLWIKTYFTESRNDLLIPAFPGNMGEPSLATQPQTFGRDQMSIR